MAPAADLFSMLPNELLCLILSELPIKEAVRSSMISKRWRLLYTQIPKLTLSYSLIMGPVLRNRHSIAATEKIVSSILQKHSCDLEAFDLYHPECSFSCQSVRKWLRYVATKKVQNLALRHSKMVNLPPELFSCNHLAKLKLSNYIVSNIPPNFGGFNRLITCSFQHVKFTDDSLSRLISHCPLLQKLKLNDCRGLREITISAPNLTHLIIWTDKPWEILTINCPKLESLTINEIHVKDLRVNGMLFQELSYAVWRLEMQCQSNEIELWLDPNETQAHNIWEGRFQEIMGTFILKELTIQNSRDEVENEINIPIASLTNLVQTLPHLESLFINGTFLLVFSRHPTAQWLNSPLLNLREINAILYTFGEKEMAVLGWLIENVTGLEFMSIFIPPREAGEEGKYIKFLETMRDFKFRVYRNNDGFKFQKTFIRTKITWNLIRKYMEGWDKVYD